MRPTKNILPLVIAFVVAIVLHVALLPVSAVYVGRGVNPLDAPKVFPDLVVSGVELGDGKTDTLVIGRPTTLSFEVDNRSVVPLPEAVWRDRVYLSVDDEVSEDDIELFTATSPPVVTRSVVPEAKTKTGAGGEGYRSGPHGFVVESVDAASSQMFLVVVVDDENEVDEGEYEGNNTFALPITLRDPREEEAAEALELGRDDELARVAVAWIAHDAFEDLLARESLTHQPALQDQADPIPGAPLELDPTPTPGSAAPGSAVPESVATPENTPAPESENDFTPVLASPVSEKNPVEPSPDPADASESPPPEASAQAASERSLAAKHEEERPTSAPRSDRESEPTTLVNDQAIRPGTVLVGPGLEVKTFRARFSAAARASAIPYNPLAEITFDTDGTVIHAQLITSSGFENIDGPLLSSLYRWKAVGRRLDTLDEPLRIRITILLNAAIIPEAEKQNEPE